MITLPFVSSGSSGMTVLLIVGFLLLPVKVMSQNCKHQFLRIVIELPCQLEFFATFQARVSQFLPLTTLISVHTPNFCCWASFYCYISLGTWHHLWKLTIHYRPGGRHKPMDSCHFLPPVTYHGAESRIGQTDSMSTTEPLQTGLIFIRMLGTQNI
jgi:hypothetical protein